MSMGVDLTRINSEPHTLWSVSNIEVSSGTIELFVPDGTLYQNSCHVLLVLEVEFDWGLRRCKSCGAITDGNSPVIVVGYALNWSRVVHCVDEVSRTSSV